MWNDGPAKQPWLNYFNEYELQHCCFGGDGEDGEGGSGGTEKQEQEVSWSPDTGFTTGPAGPDIGTAGEEAAATGTSGGAAQSAEESQEAYEEAVGQAVAEDTSGFGGSWGEMDTTDMTSKQVEDLYELSDGGYGYNDLTDMGFFSKRDTEYDALDRARARDIQADLRSQPGLEEEVVTYNPDTGQFETSSFAGGLAMTGSGLADVYSQFSPGAIAMDIAQGLGINKAVSDLGTSISDIVDGIADKLGISPSEVTQAQVDAVTSGVGPDAGIGEFSPSAAQTATAMGVSPQQAIDTAQIDFTNLSPGVDNSGMYSGFGDMPGYSSPSSFDASLYGMDPEDLNIDREIAAFEAEQKAKDKQDASDAQINAEFAEGLAQRASQGYGGSGVRSTEDRPLGPEEYTMSPGPASPGYGGAALDVGFMTDEALREGYAQEARDFANLGFTPDIAFEEIEGDEPIILPKKKEEEKEEPKSAMAQYFERLGVPSPYAPSTTQSASPYQAAVAAQPAGAPEDLFAKMARIRRQEALKTPKFNYTGFAPFSPNLYAAAYGISPEEARERIPALPKLKQTIGFPDDDEDETTEAYGGGGLNTLMRTR